MNYTQAMDYIEDISRRGSVLGLDTMKELMKRLGNVQDSLKFIHVAGTNGKGSTSAFISSVLIESGLKVGIYSSPSVFDYLEKIKIGRKNISQKNFARLLEVVQIQAEAMEPKPTQFEVETAVAFLAFYEEKCDVVVLECGMGGETDATNIINTTVLSVITSISLDHTAILGNTTTEIAEIKAGIIKPKVPIVTMAQDSEVLSVLEKKAEKNNSDFYVADADKNISVIRDEYENIVYSANFMGNCFDNIAISLSGEIQKENSYLALASILLLKEYQHFEGINEKTIKKGLKKAENPGRLERIFNGKENKGKNSIDIIIDGAHNPDAAIFLKESLQKYFSNRDFIFIMGMLADKNYEMTARIMSPLAKHIITLTPPNNIRALDGLELAKCVMKYNNNVSQASSVEEALELAQLLGKKNDVIIAFGSLSYLGRLKKAVKANYDRF